MALSHVTSKQSWKLKDFFLVFPSAFGWRKIHVLPGNREIDQVAKGLDHI
jgi:hypothetical protein